MSSALNVMARGLFVWDIEVMRMRIKKRQQPRQPTDVENLVIAVAYLVDAMNLLNVQVTKLSGDLANAQEEIRILQVARGA
jgi:hypothetical protein